MGFPRYRFGNLQEAIFETHELATPRKPIQRYRGWKMLLIGRMEDALTRAMGTAWTCFS